MIKLFISDVDGVLTDGSMYYSESGDEMKRFSTYDGMAFIILNKIGIKTAIITSEDSMIVTNRAKKMKIDFVHQGMTGKGKLEVVRSICEKNNISFDSVSYIGDDVNCFELLSNVKYAACPSNAVKKIKDIPNILQLSTKGGDGAVREYLNYLLENKLI